MVNLFGLVIGYFVTTLLEATGNESEGSGGGSGGGGSGGGLNMQMWTWVLFSAFTFLHLFVSFAGL